jgi:hypothetical protein
MNNQIERELNGLAEVQTQPVEERIRTEAEDQRREVAPASVPDETAERYNGNLNEAVIWHAEAGRKGARRVHQLIQHGLLYEQEHGLTRGRQRLRQLIEEGKLYEQEHRLGSEKPKRRRPRVDRDQLVGTFVSALLRLVKPAYRGQLAQALQILEDEGKEKASAD